jgi:hypothetical protein
MYFHVLENTQRNRQPHYKLIKTYKNYAMLEKWLLKTGKPVWVIENRTEQLPINNFSDPIMVGGHTANYWNSGGWGTTTMPVLPLVTK